MPHSGMVDRPCRDGGIGHKDVTARPKAAAKAGLRSPEQPSTVVDLRQGLQIAIRSLLGNFCSAVEVGDTPTQEAPRLGTFRVAFARAINPEIRGVIHRHFRAQHAAQDSVGFVVELQGIPVHRMFDPHPLFPFPQVGLYLALVIVVDDIATRMRAGSRALRITATRSASQFRKYF